MPLVLCESRVEAGSSSDPIDLIVFYSSDIESGKGGWLLSSPSSPLVFAHRIEGFSLPSLDLPVYFTLLLGSGRYKASQCLVTSVACSWPAG